MTLQEILTASKNLIDELDIDEQVDVILKNAINKAIVDLSKLDPSVATAYVPVIQGRAELPNDCLEIFTIIPSLEANEKRKGRYILSNRDVTFEVSYNVVREPLVASTDEPDLHMFLHDALVMYACGMYFKHRKKPQISKEYMQEYYSIRTDFEQLQYSDGFVEYVQDVIY